MIMEGPLLMTSIYPVFNSIHQHFNLIPICTWKARSMNYEKGPYGCDYIETQYRNILCINSLSASYFFFVGQRLDMGGESHFFVTSEDLN